MCRSIKVLFNFDPPATDEEIQAAALQFVRKLSGFTRPSQANTAVFEAGVQQITEAAKILLSGLSTHAHPHDREEMAAKARAKRLASAG